MHSTGSLFDGAAETSLLPKKKAHDEAHFDITAMIDLVFMMNIFFLVTTITAVLEELDLPAATHVVAADRDESVVVSILANKDGREGGVIYIGEAKGGKGLVDPAEQERQVNAAIEDGLRNNQTTVLIKAEKGVRLRDIAKVSGWASSHAGTELKLAVLEKE